MKKLLAILLAVIWSLLIGFSLSFLFSPFWPFH